jgi:hypothetical protein
MKSFLKIAAFVYALTAGGLAASGTTLIYSQQEVNPSAVWGYMPPWNIPIYVSGGPYLITRGVGFNEIHQTGDRQEVECTGFVAGEERHIHGTGPMVMQSYGRKTGISLSGPSKTDSPYISALYVDYFNTGEDIRPWRDANTLALEANVAVPQVQLNARDVGYVQYSILLEDATTGKYIWWVWQVYDVRSTQPDEFLGVDVTPDGGHFSYVATTFASDGLAYSTTSAGSAEFQHSPWNIPQWYSSKITRQNFQNGVNAIAASFPEYSSLSRNPEDYKLRAFYFYPEIYLGNLASEARICTQSQGAILRTE